MALESWPKDLSSQVALTLNVWKSDGPRLLVLDNFEDVEKVNHVLSRLRHSNLRLLITSRRTDWPITANISFLTLELLEPEESLTFLKKSLYKRKDGDNELMILAERLGHLPLALELASRYLSRHPRLSVDEYLLEARHAFEHSSMKGWRNDLPIPTQHDLDLQRTFSLSWEALTNEEERNLYQIAGYFALIFTAIPTEIFETALGISSNTCDEILNTLYGLSLLHPVDTSHSAIHPLLAEYARILLWKERQEDEYATKSRLRDYLQRLNDKYEALRKSKMRIPPHLVMAMTHMLKYFGRIVPHTPPAPTTVRERQLYEELKQKVRDADVIEQLVYLEHEFDMKANREELLEKIMRSLGR